MNMILRPTFTLLTLSPTVEGKSHAEVEEKNKSGLTWFIIPVSNKNLCKGSRNILWMNLTVGLLVYKLNSNVDGKNIGRGIWLIMQTWFIRILSPSKSVTACLLDRSLGTVKKKKRILIKVRSLCAEVINLHLYLGSQGETS